MDAIDLISALTGAAQANLPPDHKLATIDPAYAVGGSYPSSPALPKVTFDGETSLTTKRYPVINGYIPRPNERVLMIPVGRTYVIAGPVGVVAPLLSRSTNLLASTGALINVDQPPGCKVRISGTYGTVSGTNTLVPWSNSYTTKEYEVGGTWHDGAGATPDRLTVPTGMDGFFDVSWAVTYPPGAGNVRIANIQKNGVNLSQGEPILNVSTLFNTCISGQRSMIAAVAGDYFNVQYFQNSGGTLNVVTDVAATYLSVMRRSS